MISQPESLQAAQSAVLAIDIGGTHFRAGLFDCSGNRLQVTEGDTSAEGGREWMLEAIRERARLLIRESELPVSACGVSFGGPVDYRLQQVSSMHVAGWQDFRLAEWVNENLGLDCLVDNDANAGALGESRYGAGRGSESMIYLTISTGIGGGIVCKSQVWHGKDSIAGEIGHLRLTDDGPPCSCGGWGCLEAFSSGTAIGRRAQALAKTNPEQLQKALALAGGDPEPITAEIVFRAAVEGEPAAASIIREAARWLARGLMMAIRIIDPDVIVLGGGVALAGDALLNPVRESLAEYAVPALKPSTEIRQAELGNYSPLYGAAALAIDAGDL